MLLQQKNLILIYSSKYLTEPPLDKMVRKHLAKQINNKMIDICNFKIRDIKKCIKVDKKKYEEYKYSFLTPKNKLIENTSNYQIIANLMKKI